MVLKHSVIEMFLNEVGINRPDLLPIFIEAIQEEHDRWERGDLTKEERVLTELAKKMGEALAQNIDNMMLSIFNDASHPKYFGIV